MKLLKHPGVIKGKPVDIALLKLKEKIEFNDYSRPVCLPDGYDYNFYVRPGKNAFVSGWGSPNSVSIFLSFLYKALIGDGLLLFGPIVGFTFLCRVSYSSAFRPILTGIVRQKGNGKTERIVDTKGQIEIGQLENR